MPETSKEFFDRAREATAKLRDAARDRGGMHAFVRDPLVLAIHAVVDLCETVTTGQSPCGHPTAYAVKMDDKGAAITCLQCRAEQAEADNAILKALIGKEIETRDDRSLDSAAAGKALMHQRGYDLLRYCRGYLQDEGLISLSEYIWLVSMGSYATSGDPTKPGQGSPGPRRLESYDEMRERLTHLDAMTIVAQLGYHLSTYAATVRTDGTPNNPGWLEELFTLIEAVQLAAKAAGVKEPPGTMQGERPTIKETR